LWAAGWLRAGAGRPARQTLEFFDPEVQ
jgi:hypothetical protein